MANLFWLQVAIGSTLFTCSNTVHLNLRVDLGRVILVLPFQTWILKGYFDNIPRDIDASAMIDGCGSFLSMPAICHHPGRNARHPGWQQGYQPE